LGILALLAGVVPVLVPQALAFPYQANVSGHRVWSERPLDQAALERVLARTDELVSASPIALPAEPRRIFLTSGGWRWHWLTLSASVPGPFAISRRPTENIVINASDVAQDLVTTGAAVGGRRSLSSVIAHETAHGMLRRRYGMWIDLTAPQWLREGYCDYVAQESSLTPEQVAELEAKGIQHPALPYFHGRWEVAQMLAANGGSVDELFSGGGS